ncbi:DUF1932 domain-containing protein [Undibacterium sp. RTI2.1]|uniref:DUF1932 domain-containing protein n=1 Tax=unclassified Undibacterium TaxID=2630295 RepID=UPI002B226980|nr:MULTISPECIES: DUF1932 domain-containing protein [unclassified Undibacterium]MEB0032197.1 DUF1932 domain-containing protein [Undibacterium sp. RTI2.1]MEB0118271.1 DUF1932 domain-containing protein [Undibacterium sp. RTI2.2]
MKIGVVGYGEVGKIFAVGLKQTAESVCCWDIRFESVTDSELQLMHAGQHQVKVCASVAELCAQSDLIISVVTASNALAVAEETARHLRPGSGFLDCNSASPQTKQQSGKLIEAADGYFVEAGVMTSVPLYGLKVPMLLGGARAGELARTLSDMGMHCSAVSNEVGVASAIKMCRSVMIKGLEALVIESFTTARSYGVEQQMIATLYETFPSIDWEKQASYFYSRVAQHGKRRAEEMREVANTISEAGFDPLMASAIAEKDDWMAQHTKAGLFDGITKEADWQEFADRLTSLLPRKAKQ